MREADHAVGFRVTQGLHSLFLGLWFGAMVMLAVGAGATFHTVRAHDVSLGLAPYNDPALAENASGILAGAITGSALGGLRVIQTICLIALLAIIVAQFTLCRRYLAGWKAGAVRITLILAAATALAFDAYTVSPNVWRHRDQIYDPALSPADRAAARPAFDYWHATSTRVHGTATLLLAAALIATPFAYRPPSVSLDSVSPPEAPRR